MTAISKILLCLLLICALALLSAGKFLVVTETTKYSDLCKAMSGARYRLDHVIDLYKDGLCGRVAFIGGKEGKEISYAAKMANYAIEAGVPAFVIVTDETDIFSSHAELVRLRSLIESNFNRPVSITMVTSEFHTRRVKITWSWLFDDSIQLRLIAVSSDTGAGSWLWWRSAKSRQLVTREYIKIVYYYLRYRINFPLLSKYLARFDKIND